jgi:hypothetical protein
MVRPRAVTVKNLDGKTRRVDARFTNGDRLGMATAGRIVADNPVRRTCGRLLADLGRAGYFFLEVRFRGTFPPSRRASLRPIAIACLRLVTFLPDPERSVPFLRLRIARATFRPARFPYFAMCDSFRA